MVCHLLMVFLFTNEVHINLYIIEYLRVNPNPYANTI